MVKSITSLVKLSKPNSSKQKLVTLSRMMTISYNGIIIILVKIVKIIIIML